MRLAEQNLVFSTVCILFYPHLKMMMVMETVTITIGGEGKREFEKLGIARDPISD